MKSGIEPHDNGPAETLGDVLDQIDIRDSDWRIGRYEILEEIGRGGMGVIYRARQQFSRRIVALKRVLAYHADSAATLARFRREAEAISLLDHPNILPIYEVGESEDKLPFFAMKFAPGGSLREVGPALERIPKRVVSLMLPVARAIESAHAQGILHRDLKPGNILLDGRGQPLVSDFGLAKWLDASGDLTQTLTIFGTPGYIAPEQARGSTSQLGPASDIYSLGAILFDLLAGRPPFLGEHTLAVISQTFEKPAPRLRSLAPLVDRDLETICARCLERDPTARYDSAGHLADDLERWLQGKSILARPVSPPVRFWRWARRNPALTASGAACLILAALSWWKISDNLQFQDANRRNAALQHSVAVLPFLDLDNASTDDKAAGQVASALRSSFSQFGPSRVVQTLNSEVNFAAAPRPDELAALARQATVRAVLTGTKRLVNGKPIYSIRIVDPTRPDLILAKSTNVGTDTKDPYGFLNPNGADLYHMIGAPHNQRSDTKQPNQAASDLVLAGRALMERRTAADSDRAIDCFEKAIAADSSLAPAHAILAIARSARWFLGGRPDLLQLAETAAKNAVKLDPQLGEGHRALSLILEQQGHIIEAREEAFRAIELDGIDEVTASRVAGTTRALGRPDIALSWLRIMKHLQSQPARGDFVIGDGWSDLCEDAKAEQAYHETSELRPDLPEGWIGICHLRMLQGDFATALRICSENEKKFSQFDFTPQMVAQCHFFARRFVEAKRIYAALALQDPQGGGNFYGAISYESALGRLQLATGEKERGRQVLRSALQHELAALASAPKHSEVLFRTAAIEAALGLKDSAFGHLRSATSEGWIDFRSLRLDPRFDLIRDDPRYREIFDTMATRVTSLRVSLAAQTGSNTATTR